MFGQRRMAVISDELVSTSNDSGLVCGAACGVGVGQADEALVR